MWVLGIKVRLNGICLYLLSRWPSVSLSGAQDHFSWTWTCLFTCFCFCFKQYFSVQLWLSQNSLYSPVWPQTHRNLTVSISGVTEIKSLCQHCEWCAHTLIMESRTPLALEQDWHAFCRSCCYINERCLTSLVIMMLANIYRKLPLGTAQPLLQISYHLVQNAQKLFDFAKKESEPQRVQPTCSKTHSS